MSNMQKTARCYQHRTAFHRLSPAGTSRQDTIRLNTCIISSLERPGQEAYFLHPKTYFYNTGYQVI